MCIGRTYVKFKRYTGISTSAAGRLSIYLPSWHCTFQCLRGEFIGEGQVRTYHSYYQAKRDALQSDVVGFAGYIWALCAT